MSAFQDKEKLLKDAGVEVALRNNDQHFICYKNGMFVDYWPKSGLFIDRATSTKRNGIKELVAFFESVNQANEQPKQDRPLNSEGMTLRDYFATHAMEGMVTDVVIDAQKIARMAYELADAMMKERGKTQ